MTLLAILPYQIPCEDELSNFFLLDLFSCKHAISALHRQRNVLIATLKSAKDPRNNNYLPLLDQLQKELQEYSRCLDQILRSTTTDEKVVVTTTDDEEIGTGMFLPQWTWWSTDGDLAATALPTPPQQRGFSLHEFVAWEHLHAQWNLAVVHTMLAAGDHPKVPPRRSADNIIDHDAAAAHFSTAVAHVQQCRDILLQPISLQWSATRSIVLSPELLTTWKMFLEAQVQRASVSSLLAKEKFDQRLVVGAASAGKVLMDRFLTYCCCSASSSSEKSPLLTQRQLQWEESARAWSRVLEATMYYHHSFIVGGDPCTSINRANRVIGRVAEQNNESNNSPLLDPLHHSQREVLIQQIRLRKKDLDSSSVVVVDDDDEDSSSSSNENIPLEMTPKFYIPSNRAGGHFSLDLEMNEKEARRKTRASELSRVLVKKARRESPALPYTQQGIAAAVAEGEASDAKDALAKRRRQGTGLFASFQKAIQQSSRNWLLVFVYNDAEQKRAFSDLKTKNPVVGDIIDAGFVVWSAWVDDAVHFTEKFTVTSFPHISIVEPQSGEPKWRMDGCQFHQSSFVERFADAAFNFCGHNPFDGLTTDYSTANSMINSNLMKTATIPQCEPPTHLVYTAGGFRSALKEAGTCRRWMLVNIQADKILASHHLNRDVWRNSMVDGLVRENFVFWQKQCTADEGRVYSRLFRVAHYPHVAILNPFTGKVVWSQEGWSSNKPLTAESFVEAFINLRPTPEIPSRSNSQASVAGTVGGASEDLLSLLEDWDRLLAGTSIAFKKTRYSLS